MSATPVTSAHAQHATARPSWLSRIRDWLPEGRELPAADWQVRHRAILLVIWGHAIGTAAFGYVMRVPPAQGILEPLLIALVGAVASWRALSRRVRSATAALALVASSAVIVQFSGGYIEAHFHFFVVLAVIAAYQDWIPFLLAIAFVAVDHGVVGTLFPQLVYNHHDAIHNPWKWALIHAAMVLGESAALLVGWKVTEKARRQTDLVLESAGEGILGLDLDGRVTFANEAAGALAGRAATAMHGMPLADCMPGLATPRVRQATRAAARGEARIAAQGTHVEWVRNPIQEGGELVGSVLSLRDITERKEAEDALRDAVSTLAATLESTTDGILVIDAGGRIAWHNQKFAQMWRIPPAILEKREDAKAIAFVADQLEEPEAFIAKVRELYASPEASSFDTLQFKDGRVFERYSQPQRAGEVIAGRVWSFRDVTDRKRAEDERRVATDRLAEISRLREMDRMKTQFVNTLSHELRTPLTPIKLQLHILKMAREDPEAMARSTEVIERNFHRMSRLVDELLEVARLQAGALKLQRSPIDLSAVVSEALDSFHDVARSRGIALDVRAGTPATVVADPDRIAQVTYNLLTNALKFTPDGGRIALEVGADERAARVTIRDSGMGIDPAVIDRLFEPFSQVHDVSQQTAAGTGLGLYICRGLIEGHGGRIWVESEGLGKGTTFRFEIPR